MFHRLHQFFGSEILCLLYRVIRDQTDEFDIMTDEKEEQVHDDNDKDENEVLEYKEPTWPLRIAIFLVWYCVFMGAAVAGIYLFVRLDIFLFVLFPLLFLIWTALNLSNYDNRARVVSIVFSAIMILFILVLFYFNQEFTPLGISVFLITAYIFYVMVLHKESTILFSGRYKRDPDTVKIKEEIIKAEDK